MRLGLGVVVWLLVLATPTAALAAGGDLHVPPAAAAPFVLLLLAIAVLPLVAGHWWHSNRNKAIVAAVLAVPTAVYLLAVGEAGRAALLPRTRRVRLVHHPARRPVHRSPAAIVLRGDLAGRPRPTPPSSPPGRCWPT